jgi:hypothetical protein
LNLQFPGQLHCPATLSLAVTMRDPGNRRKTGGLSDTTAHHLPHLFRQLLIDQLCQLYVPGARRAQKCFRCFFHLQCGILFRIARIAFLGHVELFDGLDQAFRFV